MKLLAAYAAGIATVAAARRYLPAILWWAFSRGDTHDG